MKKIIILGVTLICSVFLLSGCSYSDLKGGNSSDNPGVIDNNNSGNNNAGVVDNNEPTEKTISWEPNKPFTVPNIAEINITSVSAMEEVKPPKTNGVYSYQANQEGETYIVAKGSFKNLLSETFDDWDNFNGKLIYDNNYEYNVYVKFATNSDNDFYTDPKPLQSLNAYFIASVPSDLIKTDKNGTFKLQFTDNSDISSDIYEYHFVFNNN